MVVVGSERQRMEAGQVLQSTGKRAAYITCKHVMSRNFILQIGKLPSRSSRIDSVSHLTEYDAG